MNKVVLMGRLSRDPDCFETKGDEPILVTRYTLAVTRKRKPDEADFINCVSFGKLADLADKYFKKGMRVCVSGHLQTGSYEKDGITVYTTDVIVDEQEFAQSKTEETKTRRSRR